MLNLFSIFISVGRYILIFTYTHELHSQGVSMGVLRRMLLTSVDAAQSAELTAHPFTQSHARLQPHTYNNTHPRPLPYTTQTPTHPR